MSEQGVLTVAKRILCGDRALACDVEVTIDPKLWFEPGTGAPCKKRTVVPEMAVLHWTGAENPVETFYNTCLKRKVSAHFFVADDGTVHQLADVWDTNCYHAHSTGGVVNKRSVGIEIQNKGFAPEGRVKRGVYVDTIKGKKLKLLMFTATQVESVLAILNTLVAADVLTHGVLPRSTTLAGTGDLTYDSILKTPMTTKALATFNGVCAHYHVPDSGKYDAGTQLFQALIDEGWDK